MGSRPPRRWAAQGSVYRRCLAMRPACGRGWRALLPTAYGRTRNAFPRNNTVRSITLHPPQIRICSQYILADRFEVRTSSLHLLRHRVHVAEAALERVAIEDRGRAGLVIGSVHDLLRLMDRERRSLPDLDPVLRRHFARRKRRVLRIAQH